MAPPTSCYVLRKSRATCYGKPRALARIFGKLRVHNDRRGAGLKLLTMTVRRINNQRPQSGFFSFQVGKIATTRSQSALALCESPTNPKKTLSPCKYLETFPNPPPATGPKRHHDVGLVLVACSTLLTSTASLRRPTTLITAVARSYQPPSLLLLIEIRLPASC